MADGVKGGTEVKEDEDREVTRVCRQEDVVGDFYECGFSAVKGTEAGLKGFVKVIGVHA